MALWQPITSRTKPVNFGLRYDGPQYFGRMGGQPALDLPLFGPGPRGQAKDYSPNGNNGALGSAAIWKPTAAGIGVHVDGTSNGIINIAAMNGASSSTQSATMWAYFIPESRPAYAAILESRASSQLLGLLVSGSGAVPLTASWNNTAAEYNAATGLNLVLGVPNFCAAVVNGALLSVYLGVRGILSKATISITATNRDMSGSWYMGYDSHNGGIPSTFLSAGILTSALADARIDGFYNSLWSRFSRRQAVFGVSAAAGGGPPPFIIGGGFGNFICAA